MLPCFAACSPHICGIAAALRAARPGFTPATVKSALMTTANPNIVPTVYNGFPPSNPHAFGAGEVNPTPSLDPGLTFEAGQVDWLRFLCGLPTATRVASGNVLLTDAACAALCPPPAPGALPTLGCGELYQLNQPSIAINGEAVVASIACAALRPQRVRPHLILCGGKLRATGGSKTGVSKLAAVCWNELRLAHKRNSEPPLIVLPPSACCSACRPDRHARDGAPRGDQRGRRGGWAPDLHAGAHGPAG